MSDPIELDDTDRLIINELQGGFPVSDEPFKQVGQRLGLEEADLIKRIEKLLESKALSRFGPMFNADRMGGAFCLCAMRVPQEQFDMVADQVNAHPEVAHNYEREHFYNMWFVVATEHANDITDVTAQIECETGHLVQRMPKLEEFFIGLRVSL